ncbi:MAG: hypothetical protein KDC48_14615 [Planctomycetes bacterium]|nr:hypothetical protein [Planctomycetota bacterium]
MLRFSILSFALTAPLAAQIWSPLDGEPSSLSALMYDVGEQRLLGVVAWPQETWSFDGSRWRRHQPDGLHVVGSLQPHTRFAAYDEGRGTAVLATAPIQFQPARTYVSSLGGWRPVSSAPGLESPGLAFDPGSNRLIAFGGYDIGNETDAMFAWDGSIWWPLSPSVRPSPRVGHAMALDRARGRIVLFGGRFQYALLGDTWEFDGVNWTQLAPATAPTARSGPMAWDAARQRVVLLGGYGPTGNALADTWEWDGVNWSASGNLPTGAGGLACSDAATVVVANARGELWRRAGTGWNVLHASPRPQVYASGLCWDALRGEALCVDGFGGGTWTWNGGWQQRSTAAPSGHIGSTVAPLGNDLVLFGGLDSGYLPFYAFYDETWTWNGQGWTQRAPATVPPPRHDHAMVALGNSVLMFGGHGPLGELGDTWTYDGIDWTQRQPAASPAPRRRGGLAFDGARQRAVLFGGATWGTPLGDTWEWDGQNWIAFAPVGQPQAGVWGMTATPSGVVMQQVELWSWDGSDWTSSLVAGPQPYDGHLLWDTGRQRLLQFGAGGDTYSLGAWSANVADASVGCGNPTGLHLFGEPRLGTTPDVHFEGAPNALVLTIFGLQLQTTVWAPGCLQLSTADAVTVGVTDTLGHLDTPLVIPAAPALLGLRLFTQAAVLDGGPVFGASLTTSLQLVIGD